MGLFKSIFIIVAFGIMLFFIQISCHAQLFKPFYHIPCENIQMFKEKVSISLTIEEKDNAESVVMINNPNNWKIIRPVLLNPSEVLELVYFENDSLIIKAKNRSLVTTERNKVIVMAKIRENCIDTLGIISIKYSSQLFKRIRYLGRIELGYLINSVSFSDRSILSDESYLENSNQGWLMGLEIIEFRAPSSLLYLGMSLGVNYISLAMSSSRINSGTNNVSVNEYLITIRGDLPFYFIDQKLKDFSFRTYLSFPFLQTASISSNNNNRQNISLNNKSNLKLFYGIGINYNISKWFAIEYRNSLESYESINTNRQIGSKINYNTIKSEIIFSLINVYDNLNELLSD